MAITLPFTFTNGTIADATQVDANMNALANGALPIAGTGTINMTGPITIQTSGTTGNSYIEFLTSGGTTSAPTALQPNTPIGGVYGGGFDGAAWSDGGEIAIDFQADGNWAPGSHPTRITFGTTPVGAIHAHPAMEIFSTQDTHLLGTLTVGNIAGQSPWAISQKPPVGAGGADLYISRDGIDVMEFWKIPAGTGIEINGTIYVTGHATFAQNVDVTGNLTAANFPSEARFKDHIESYSQGLAAITQLRPVSWEWNEMSGIVDPHRPIQYGVLADEAQQSLPQAIGTRKMKGEVVKTLDDRPILYALVNAVKELADRISTLEEKIDAV